MPWPGSSLCRKLAEDDGDLDVWLRCCNRPCSTDDSVRLCETGAEMWWCNLYAVENERSEGRVEKGLCSTADRLYRGWIKRVDASDQTGSEV